MSIINRAVDKVLDKGEKVLDKGEKAKTWFNKNHKKVAGIGAGAVLGGMAARGAMKHGIRNYIGNIKSNLKLNKEAYDLAESLTADFKPKRTIFAVKPMTKKEKLEVMKKR